MTALNPPPSLDPFVLILGMHRSGTSVLGAALEALGLRFGDHLLPPRPDNPRGFWEDRRVVAAEEALLVALDRAWPGEKAAAPYPTGWDETPAAAALTERLSAVIASEVSAAQPGLWAVKDPRACRLLPVWRRAAAAAGARMIPVIGLRDPRAVAASLATRDGLDPATASHLWLAHVLAVVDAYADAMPLAVDYAELTTQPDAVAARLAAWLGLPPPAPGALAAVIDPALTRSAATGIAVDPLASRVHQALLTQAAGAPAGPELLAALAQWRAAERLCAPWATALDRLTDPLVARRPLDAPMRVDALLAGRAAAQDRAQRPAFTPPRPPVGDLFSLPAIYQETPTLKRICIVTWDIIGPVRNGGIGALLAGLARDLAAGGHDVTVLYCLGDQVEQGDMAHWIGWWADRGVRLVPLPELGLPLVGAATCEGLSLRVFYWLSTQPRFDVVHGHEWRGPLFHATAARRAGLAFPDTLFVVQPHSTTLWHLLGDQSRPDGEDLVADALERGAIAQTDYVVSSSQYLLDWLDGEGWTRAAPAAAQPNLPSPAAEAPQPLKPPAMITELVFFGRLERRKGLAIFCDAVERLSPALRARLKITLLGKHSRSAGVWSADWLAQRCAAWPTPPRVVDDRDAMGAAAFLDEDPGRLAVMPSLVENSPLTVSERLAAGGPFIASTVGGIPELIAAEDRDRVLFAPNAADLAAAIERACAAPFAPPRGAVDQARNRAVWLGWHGRIDAAATARRATPILDTLGAPLVQPVSLTGGLPAEESGEGIAPWIAIDPAALWSTLLDKLDPTGDAPAGYIAVSARGAPKGGAVAALALAAAWAQADWLTGFGEILNAEAQPWALVPALGAAPAAGVAARRALAGPMVLVRRAALAPYAALPIGRLDALAVAMAGDGLRTLVSPMGVATVAPEPAPPPDLGLADAAPSLLRPLLQSVLTPAPENDASEAAALRAELAALRGSTSWRLTAPLRRIIGAFRRSSGR